MRAIVIVILQTGSNHTNVTLFGADGQITADGNHGGDGFDGSGAGGSPWFASSADTHALPRPAKPVHLKQPVSIQSSQPSFCQVFSADAHETSAHLVFYDPRTSVHKNFQKYLYPQLIGSPGPHPVLTLV